MCWIGGYRKGIHSYWIYAGKTKKYLKYSYFCHLSSRLNHYTVVISVYLYVFLYNLPDTYIIYVLSMIHHTCVCVTCDVCLFILPTSTILYTFACSSQTTWDVFFFSCYIYFLHFIQRYGIINNPK